MSITHAGVTEAVFTYSQVLFGCLFFKVNTVFDQEANSLKAAVHILTISTLLPSNVFLLILKDNCHIS